jgi:Bacterial protein of unknown function (DUF899)
VGFGSDKEYRFETDEGSASLKDLFRGRSQLLVYLANHDVMLCAVSRAPLAKLQAYKRRMGWRFPWASSFRSDFNYDFQVTFTEEQQQSRVVEYNFRAMDPQRSQRPTDSCRLWHGRGDDYAGSAGHERVRARGRRRIPQPTRRTYAGWTASGGCTSGSTAHPKGATRRWCEDLVASELASGIAATTSTTSPKRSRGCRGATAGRAAIRSPLVRRAGRNQQCS